MKIVMRIIINAVAIWLATYFVAGFTFSGDLIALIIVAIIFGLINTFIRPIIAFVSFPVTLLTLGLFTLVINALMLWLTVWFSSSLSLEGGGVGRFITVFVAAIIISLVSTVLGWFLSD